MLADVNTRFCAGCHKRVAEGLWFPFQELPVPGENKQRFTSRVNLLLESLGSIVFRAFNPYPRTSDFLPLPANLYPTPGTVRMSSGVFWSDSIF